MLAREDKLTRRLESLPDDLLFATQGFRTEKPDPAGSSSAPPSTPRTG